MTPKQTKILAEIANNLRHIANQFDALDGVPGALPSPAREEKPKAEKPKKTEKPKEEPAPAPKEEPKVEVDPGKLFDELKAKFVTLVDKSREEAVKALKTVDDKAKKLGDLAPAKHAQMLNLVLAALDGLDKPKDDGLV